MAAVYSIDVVKCRCINGCPGFKVGSTYYGRVELYRTGAPLFIIPTSDNQVVKYLHHQFVEYFELVK